jgi:hypothetical protein
MQLCSRAAAPRALYCRAELQVRAASAAQPLAADEAALSALLAATGGSVALRLGSGSAGRGLFTAAEVHTGDVLLRVPLSAALVVTTGGSRPLVEALLAAHRAAGMPSELAALLGGVTLPAHARLAAGLLWATGRGGGAAAPAADGGWAAASALLPADGFTCEAAGEVEAAEAEELVAAHAPALAAQLAERGCGSAGWRWALACVASRTFGADAWGRTGAREGLLGAFVPGADLMNHSFAPNCEFRLRADARLFEVFARRALRAGEEACICYGEGLSNDELRRRYGFSLADNPNGEAARAGKPQGSTVRWGQF